MPSPTSSISGVPAPEIDGVLRIISWNVNGIDPFIQSYLQKSIDAFFQPSESRGHKRKRDAVVNHSETDDEDDENLKEGKASLRALLARHGWPHILLLQEVKIRPNDSKVIEAVRKAINDSLSESGFRMFHLDRRKLAEGAYIGKLTDGGPAYDAQFNLPRDLHNAKGFGGKIYGVATIIRKDFAEKYVTEVRDADWDLEGRVQVIETRGLVNLSSQFGSGRESNDLSNIGAMPKVDESTSLRGATTTIPSKLEKLAILNIYAVNGTTNPYRSPTSGQVVGTRHDRKLAVHRHLLEECLKLESRGFQVVVAGDLNIARARIDGYPNLRTWPEQHCRNRADFNSKFFEGSQEADGGGKHFKGIDTFRFLHGSEARYSYHSRSRVWGTSCDRVDLIISSQSLKETIVGAGIMDNPRDRGPSDHCPIWVDIRIQTPQVSGHMLQQRTCLTIAE